jgi:hypothetical protein
MRMRGWLVGIAAVGLAGGALAAPRPIDPATLAGEWSGTWENRSFTPHPTGNVIASIATPDAEHVVIDYSASGGVFGQCAVSPTMLTLVKGTDFTDTAVSFTRQDVTFGAVKVQSKKKGQRLVAKGTGTCGGGGPAWSAKAKYRAPTFAVKMKIRLPGKIAKTTITLAKQ